MKTSSAFLWQFIHTLTKNEKQFFRRNYIQTGGDAGPLYLRLFDAIEKQAVYNEAEILEKFTPQLQKKNIAFQKHYLYRQLCEALLQYSQEHELEQSIYKDILLIRLFRKKGLPDEAQNVWVKAIRKAREIESFAMLGLLKKEFEKMILWSSTHTRYDELHGIFKNNIINYDQYAELITLRDIYAEALLLKRKAHYDLDPLSKEQAVALLASVEQRQFGVHTGSFWFRHYYRMAKATLLYLLNEKVEEALSLTGETFREWKEHCRHIETNTENFIEVMSMINHVGVQQGAYAYVEESFSDPVHDFITQEAYRANFEAIKYLALNKVYNKMARYTEVAQLVQHMKKRSSDWEPFLSIDINRTVNLSLGIASFVLEQYSDALNFIKRGIIHFKDNSREELAKNANMLLLLIAYNLNNDRLFEAQYRSTYSFFYKQKIKYAFATGLIQCLNRTFYMKAYNDRIAEYKKTLEKLADNSSDEVQQKAFSFFNYPAWLQSRIDRISYREFVTRKVKAEA